MPVRPAWFRVEFDLEGLGAGSLFTYEVKPNSSSQVNSDVDLTTVYGNPLKGRTRPLFFTAGSSIPGIGAGVICP